jgi:hypothetical protein
MSTHNPLKSLLRAHTVTRNPIGTVERGGTATEQEDGRPGTAFLDALDLVFGQPCASDRIGACMDERASTMTTR